MQLLMRQLEAIPVTRNPAQRAVWCPLPGRQAHALFSVWGWKKEEDGFHSPDGNLRLSMDADGFIDFANHRVTESHAWVLGSQIASLRSQTGCVTTTRSLDAVMRFAAAQGWSFVQAWECWESMQKGKFEAWDARGNHPVMQECFTVIPADQIKSVRAQGLKPNLWLTAFERAVLLWKNFGLAFQAGLKWPQAALLRINAETLDQKSWITTVDAGCGSMVRESIPWRRCVVLMTTTRTKDAICPA